MVWLKKNWKQMLVLIASAIVAGVIELHPEWRAYALAVGAGLATIGIHLVPMSHRKSVSVLADQSGNGRDFVQPDEQAQPSRKPRVPPLPTLFMSIVVSIVAIWTVFLVGCGAQSQELARNAARANILLVADGAVKMQDACADLAMAHKDLELAKACARSYDGTRAALLGAEALVDAWDAGSTGHFVCTIAAAVSALGDGARALAIAGGKIPPAVDDALAMGRQLAVGCSRGG